MKFQVGETLRVTDVFVPILVVKWALTVLGCLAIYLQRLVGNRDVFKSIRIF